MKSCKECLRFLSNHTMFFYYDISHHRIMFRTPMIIDILQKMQHDSVEEFIRIIQEKIERSSDFKSGYEKLRRTVLVKMGELDLVRAIDAATLLL